MRRTISTALITAWMALASIMGCSKYEPVQEPLETIVVGFNEYERDSEGRLLREKSANYYASNNIMDTVSDVAEEIEYDEQGRKSRETRDMGADDIPELITVYQYDDLGEVETRTSISSSGYFGYETNTGNITISPRPIDETSLDLFTFNQTTYDQGELSSNILRQYNYGQMGLIIEFEYEEGVLSKDTWLRYTNGVLWGREITEYNLDGTILNQFDEEILDDML